MTNTDVTLRQFRYLVSWTHQGQTGHYHHVGGEWTTPKQTVDVMDVVRDKFELDGKPVITSVFPMGEVTP